MLNLFRKLSSETEGRAVRSLLFFVLFYLYLWLEVDLRFIYHGGGLINTFPVFYRGWAFFRETMSCPGGGVSYLSAFLSQFFYYSWAGAIWVTLQAWLLCLCTDVFIKAINCPRLRFVRFIPPIVLLVTYDLYTCHFVTTMAMATALAFECLYLRIITKNKPLQLIIFLVLSVVLYTLAGGAYLLFAVLCVIYELFFRHRWRIAVLYLLLATAIPYVEGIWLFGGSIIDVFSYLLPYSWRTSLILRRMVLIAVYILYLLLPLIAVVAGLWRLLAGRAEAVKEGKKPKKRGKKSLKQLAAIFSLYSRNNKLRWIVESCLLFVITVTTVLFFHDRELKTVFAVDYYACHKNWPKVLDSAGDQPNVDLVVHAVNRALYHTGRLGSEMFSYPQHPGALFLFPGNVVANWKKIDTYIELGQMNVAEHALTESLAVFGQRPVILKRLALINMVKGNIGAARVYLASLSKTLFHANWANNYLHQLKNDPNLAAEQGIQNLRRTMLKDDYTFLSLGTEDTLALLLTENKQNRMAFEYRMAYYMLTKELDKFVKNLDGLSDFDYPRIPPLYEEAILIYNSLGSKKRINLHGRHISQKSRQRFKDFVRIYNRYGANKQAAENRLARKYGDSYIFYHLYETFGMKK